jgi:hypothetical protein
MFRRPIRRAIRRAAVGAIQENEFYLANQLYDKGQFESSAAIFAQLAQRMGRVGRLRQAANLHAKAALAWAYAGDEPRAENQANLAFGQFTLLGMKQRIIEFKKEYEQALHHPGNTVEKPGPIEPETTVVHSQKRLPAVCDQCGAPVRSDQVEWIDETSAECDFCGAILQTLEPTND